MPQGAGHFSRVWVLQEVFVGDVCHFAVRLNTVPFQPGSPSLRRSMCVRLIREANRVDVLTQMCYTQLHGSARVQHGE